LLDGFLTVNQKGILANCKEAYYDQA